MCTNPDVNKHSSVHLLRQWQEPETSGPLSLLAEGVRVLLLSAKQCHDDDGN